MPRKVRDSALETRTARARLRVSTKPYYRSLRPGLHLGYRRSQKGGSWVVRYYLGGQKYKVERFASADDIPDADGKDILTFAQAQDRAREIAAERTAQGPRPETGPFTVSHCIEEYLVWMESHRKTAADARCRAEALIVPTLGQVNVVDLTASEIQTWHREIAEAPARVRTRPGDPQRTKNNGNDPEAGRKRRSTANRTLTILKAALNRSWRDPQRPSISSDAAWRPVSPFPKAEAARIRFLTTDEISRLTTACDAQFLPLVQAAILCGARYGELARLNVADFSPDVGNIFIAESKSGKSRYIALNDDGVILFAGLSGNRTREAPMFVKASGERWGRSHQATPMRRACEAAGIDPPVSFHVLRHTFASHALMNGAALMVVARTLGHRDTTMVDRHYGHLADSYISDAIRAAAPKLGLEPSDVMPLQASPNPGITSTVPQSSSRDPKHG